MQLQQQPDVASMARANSLDSRRLSAGGHPSVPPPSLRPETTRGSLQVPLLRMPLYPTSAPLNKPRAFLSGRICAKKRHVERPDLLSCPSNVAFWQQSLAISVSDGPSIPA